MLRRSRHPVALLTCVLIMLGTVLWTSAATAMTVGATPAACLTVSADDAVRQSGHAAMAEDCHAHEVGCAMACAGLFDLRASHLDALFLVLHPAALSLPSTRHVKGTAPVPDSPPPKIL